VPQATSAANVEGIWGTSATDIYATGSGKILHSTGDGKWTAQYDPGQNVVVLPAVWALNGSAIYVCTHDDKLMRSGGDGRWVSDIIDPSKPNLWVEGVWGTSTENLYVVTSGSGVYHGVKP
jgi:hypothetical protein